METIRRGNTAEAAVLQRLSWADIPAYLPFGDGSAVDVLALVPPDGRAVRVQVKSGRVRKGCVVFNTCSTDHGSGPQSYNGRADVIAVHAAELDRVFVVPVSECPSSKGWLRLDTPKNNQRQRIRFAADYTFERWLDGLDRPSLGSAPDMPTGGSLVLVPSPSPHD